MTKKTQNYCQAVLLSICLTLLFFLPLLSKIQSHLTSPDDGPLISWLINHASHSILGKEVFWQPRFFYPYQNTLAYSDPFLSTGLLSLPFFFFSHNLVLLQNLHLLIGTAITFMGMYVLAYELTHKHRAGLLASTVFVFSYLHFQYSVHLHTFLIAGLPLAVYGLIKYQKTQKLRWFILICLSWFYQAFNAPMTALFLIFILGITVLASPKRQQLMKDKKLWLVGLSAGLITTFFYFPYFAVSHQFDYTRSLRDTAHFAFSLDRLFDYDILILSIISIYLWRTKKTRIKQGFFNQKTALLIAFVGAVLMLGPALKFNEQTIKIFGLPIPMPYGLAYYFIPGFQAFRASSRWIILLDFGWSLLLALQLAKSRVSIRAFYFAYCLLIMIFLSLNWARLPLFKIEYTPPSIYKIVKEQTESVMLELPIYVWDMAPYASHENTRLLYQSYHGKYLFNGASGFIPPQRVLQIHQLVTQPTDSTILKSLAQQGVELILVNYSQYQAMYNDNFIYHQTKSIDPAILKTAYANSTQLSLISCVDQMCLYKLNRN